MDRPGLEPRTNGFKIAGCTDSCDPGVRASGDGEVTTISDQPGKQKILGNYAEFGDTRSGGVGAF